MVKPLDIVKVVTSLLLDGVQINVIKNALIKGGLSEREVEFIIGYIAETSSNELINVLNKSINSLVEKIDKLIRISLESY